MIKLLENDDDNVFELYKKFQKRFDDFTLYHGTTKKFNHGTKINFRFRDRSKDTGLIVNTIVNYRLTQEYGMPIRNLLYTTQDLKTAKDYGKAYIVVPVGENYRLFYGEGVEDFTGHFGVSGLDFLEYVADMLAEMHDQEESEITSDKIKELFGSNYTTLNKLSVSNSVSELQHIASNAIATEPNDTDMLREVLSEFVDLLISTIDSQIIENYDINEINDKDDIPSLRTEIMAYFPDGFYLLSPDYVM